MTSIVRIQLALATVAYALAGKEQHAKLDHKVVQEHRFGGVMRSEKEKENAKSDLLEVHSSGSMRSREAVRHSQGDQEDMTHTTTLSNMHLMHTTMQRLAPPPERQFGTTTMPLRPTSQPIDLDNGFALAEFMAKDVQPGDVNDTNQTGANTTNATVANATVAATTAAPTQAPTPAPTPPPNPIQMTDQQVQNSEAAFEVTGCSGPMSHFNGVYMPSSMVNTNEACTALVWTFVNTAGRHTLYNIKGAWVLDLEGTVPSYNGADNGGCQPETASWSAIQLLQNGAAPTLYRRAAAAYTTTTTVLFPAVGEAQPYYYVVTGAGITGFNGVYYMTPLDVADVRCQRNFAKDGPDNTEYTLAFGNTGNGASVWYFQSLIGGTTNRPYVGSDDGSCSPDTSNWASVGSTGGTAPSVVRSVTATTTTSTTTTTTESSSTSTTSTVSTTINETALAANETTTSLMLQDQAGAGISSATNTTESFAERQFSMMWLRLLLPLSLGVSFQGLRCGA
jgi:hypothetical protein